MSLQDISGQKVPQVTFHTRQEDNWVDVTTNDIFAGKTVIVFSLPGAFTPTCSSTHLPRYNELASEFEALGVDDIYCLSVNDTFVMNAWKADQDAKNIKVIPDGSGEFTKGMGMLVSKDDLGFGDRSWRYSMLVKDGVIEKMFIEPQEPGDPFKVSDADTMIKYLKPDWEAKESASIITKPGCPFCTKAKMLLEEQNIPYEEIILGRDATMTSVRAITGRATAPQVFIGGKHIGGYDDLAKHFA
ncbi:Hybrid peroxiredoxin hyPrx5 [Phocoenobacter uteri]|uniref:Hybrid peroxiredoxin hyPrx5 n=1 Tax=Phocoenobacter uteri TaxID=146806 RepID=A0A379CD86_9PAST|nr:glutathione peroxidase [Phocoenobacter uteri]MDG6881607.1 glutathione peroxidase [Phocoenobacter uteri]SUB59637.1 Hybrid peroxiredoxin hyPrx5 [Phocoenobacter uteri]